MNNRNVFAMLDESMIIPQHIQMIIFRQYANKMNLEIEFYGAEIREDNTNRLFKYYLQSNRADKYLFFSIRQFYNKEREIEWEAIEAAVKKKICLHFANENIVIESIEGINNMKRLMISQVSKVAF